MLYEGLHKGEILVVIAIRKSKIINISPITVVYKIKEDNLSQESISFYVAFRNKIFLYNRRPILAGEIQRISQA
jgi:hypothetical protein